MSMGKSSPTGSTVSGNQPGFDQAQQFGQTMPTNMYGTTPGQGAFGPTPGGTGGLGPNPGQPTGMTNQQQFAIQQTMPTQPNPGNQMDVRNIQAIGGPALIAPPFDYSDPFPVGSTRPGMPDRQSKLPTNFADPFPVGSTRPGMPETPSKLPTNFADPFPVGSTGPMPMPTPPIEWGNWPGDFEYRYYGPPIYAEPFARAVDSPFVRPQPGGGQSKAFAPVVVPNPAPNPFAPKGGAANRIPPAVMPAPAQRQPASKSGKFAPVVMPVSRPGRIL